MALLEMHRHLSTGVEAVIVTKSIVTCLANRFERGYSGEVVNYKVTFSEAVAIMLLPVK